MQIDSIRFIADATVRSLIDVDAAMRIIESVYADYGRERSVLSDPPALLLPTRASAHAAFKVKGARLNFLGVAGFRMIADRMTDRGEQTVDYCWVAENTTGRLIGLVDETWLHRLRTALTGVVAAKWLARRDSRVATIIGAGQIADELPGPLSRAFALEEIRVVARGMESARRFADRHAAAATVRPFTDVDEAAAGADIIITISSSETPLLRNAHVGSGVFVCGMGGGAEIDADVLGGADRFVADDLAYAFTIGSVRGWIGQGVSRDTIIGRLDADIGEIAAGAKPGRESDSDKIVAIVQGMACCDVALAHMVLMKAGLIPEA